MAIIIPEIILKSLIDSCLLFLKTDYDSATDKTKTLLYNLLNGLVADKYNFYTQGKDLFLRKHGDARKLEVNYFFNVERVGLPTIHITLPNETTINNGIGIDEGFQDAIVSTTSEKTVYTRTFQTQYNIIITSDNTFEVVMIYHVLKSLLIAAFNDLEFYGLQNPKLSGNDIQMNPDIVPPNVFFRSLNLQIMYDTNAPSFLTVDTFTSLNDVIGIPIDEEDWSDSVSV